MRHVCPAAVHKVKVLARVTVMGEQLWERVMSRAEGPDDVGGGAPGRKIAAELGIA